MSAFSNYIQSDALYKGSSLFSKILMRSSLTLLQTFDFFFPVSYFVTCNLFSINDIFIYFLNTLMQSFSFPLRKLYWTDGDNISMANMDGSNHTLLFTNQKGPVGEQMFNSLSNMQLL